MCNLTPILHIIFGFTLKEASIFEHMTKTNDIKENFSALMRDALRARYGRIPSAAVVAREFNLRAYGTSPISQESARRWLRGVSLPEEERLRVLVNWLNLNFNDALRPAKTPMQRPATTAEAWQAPPSSGGVSRPNPLFMGYPGPERRQPLQNGSALSLDDVDLFAAIHALDQRQKSAILEMIRTTGKMTRPVPAAERIAPKEAPVQQPMVTRERNET